MVKLRHVGGLPSFPLGFISISMSATPSVIPMQSRVATGHELPALPKINSKDIERQIFTHRSVYARPTHIFEDLPNDPSPDNEKFEHLGDSVLSLVVTDLLFEMYPGLRKIRAMIVTNQTLATISQRYRLPHRLLVHPAQALALRESIHVQADVFEAFVGGLYTDQNLQVVRSWLDALFRPYVETAYDVVRTQYGLGPLTISTAPSQSELSSSTSEPSASPSPSPPSSPHTDSESNDPTPVPVTATMNTQGVAGHLALFNQHVAKMNKQVEWVPLPVKYEQYPVKAIPSTSVNSSEVWKLTKSTPTWRIKVVIDGETYGEGKGMTKKAAKNEAAKKGLDKLGIRTNA
ncbi:double-strand-specific pac1 ribonuclease [Moniliophthora roreri]|nr:double-strand-specific pac1 ribonuclease [Moniliophthora roreri]